MVERVERTFADRDQALALLRRQTWVAPDGEKDRRLQALMDERLRPERWRLRVPWRPGTRDRDRDLEPALT